MIDKKIIKIASITKFEGLKNKFTHKSSAKNSFVVTILKLNFVDKKNKLNQ